MGLLDEHDATGLADLVRRREVHPRELVSEAIARAEAVDPALNVIVHRQYERALRDAETVDLDGPLAGVPFLLKDFNAEEAGERFTMGVRPLREMGYRSPVDSALAVRFRAAGLIPIGRTNVPQMALMGTTEPDLWGPTRNPWDTSRAPGGSSGGAAASVAAGVVPAAHANDISGSIRIPASICGVVGLKPGRGRVIAGSAVDAPVGMASEGVVTRSVRDTAAIVDALTATSPWWPAPPLPRPLAEEVGRPVADGLRIGVWTEAFNGSGVDPASADAATATASLLAAMGHRVEVDAPAPFSSPELWEAAKNALGVTTARAIDQLASRLGRPATEQDVEVRTWEMVTGGRRLDGAAVLATLETMQRLAADALRWWERFDLLVTPTTAGPGSPIGEYVSAYESGKGSAFTRPINVTGQPAISLPLGWPDDGLPRGVQIVAAPGGEDLLIRVAAALEAAAPWAHRRPPVWSGR